MTWHIIQCPSGKERDTEAILARLGYEDTFYPKRTVDARPRGKALRGKHQGPNTVQRAWVTGYVFVDAGFIECHRINRTHGKITLRVLSPGGVPYKVTDEQMARMRDVPQRVKDLIDQVRREERAAWEAKRPMMGQPAIVVDGTFKDKQGEVVHMQGDTVKLDLGMFLGLVTIPAMQVERVG